MSRKPPASRSAGFALMAVLVTVAALTALTAALAAGLGRGRRIEAALVGQADLRQAARGGYRAAVAALARDGSEVDSLQDEWAGPWPLQRAGELTVEIAVVDEERHLPLGGLIAPSGEDDPLQVAAFERLLRAAGLPPSISPCLLDWIDADRRPRPAGLDRLVGPPAGRDGPPLCLEELRCLPPLGPAAGEPAPEFVRLAALAGWRPAGRVNLNTAPPEVLQALSPAVTPAAAAAVAAAARRRPFVRLADLSGVPGLSPAGYADLAACGCLASRAFRVRAAARSADGLEAVLAADIIRTRDRIEVVRWSLR